MRTQLTLKTFAEVRDECEEYLNDSNNQLATVNQYLGAINRAISLWDKRVLVPQIYSLSLQNGVYEYSLPAHIATPFSMEISRSIYGPGYPTGSDGTIVWQEFNSYDVRPNAEGGFTLRINAYADSREANIIWYAPNGPSPREATVHTAIDSDDTLLLTIDTDQTHVVRPSGYLKLNDEYIAYGNVARAGAGVISALNLLRGQYQSGADSHAEDDEIHWCIAVDDDRLWQQLYDRVAQFVHTAAWQKSTSEDAARHEKAMVFHRDAADTFWRKEGYVSQRGVRLNIKQGALGQYPWN
jgi:hypothetical protein